MSLSRLLGLVLVVTLLPAAARAQGRTEVQPSITSGLVFDNNLFFSEDRVDDLIWRVTPAFTITRETPFGSFLGRYSFDAEWYRTQKELNTAFARQDAGISVTARPSVSTVARLDAGIDSTLRPAELNLSTHLATGRRRAWRAYAGPEVEVEVAPKTTLIGRYDFLFDVLRPRSEAGPGIPPVPSPTPEPPLNDDTFDLLPATGLTLFSHEAEFRLEHDFTDRDQFRVAYRLQQFKSEAEPFVGAHVPTVGYARRLGPATRLTFDAGPRFTLGTIDVEAEATLAHTYRDLMWTLTYARTLASSIGIAEIVNVDRVQTGVHYDNRGTTDLDLTLGYFRTTEQRVPGQPFESDLSDPSADVYQASASVTQRLGGALSVVAGLSWDLQRGRIGTPLDPAVPAISPVHRVQRQVAFIQLMLAPRVRPLPKEEEVEPTGRARPGDRRER